MQDAGNRTRATTRRKRQWRRNAISEQIVPEEGKEHTGAERAMNKLEMDFFLKRTTVGID